MTIPEYQYTLEQCDVPEVRRAALNAYRIFRRKCLEDMRGSAETSVMNQVHNLTWHTAVFRVLNEARRLEPDRRVNGPMWELIVAGYANLMTLGIRRLVDKNPKTDSVWNVIVQVAKRPELLTREMFVCYDGLPYDCEAGYRDYVGSLDMSRVSHASWLVTTGPEAWASSEMLHKAFDLLAGRPKKRRRGDVIQLSILESLRTRLSSPAIERVRNLADKRMAHAERWAEGSGAVPSVTYNGIDEALGHIVSVANYLSSSFFYDAAFASVVATAQFDVLSDLDEPWVKTEHIPALHRHWSEICTSMDRWLEDSGI
jgi:hypothetical protein